MACLQYRERDERDLHRKKRSVDYRREGDRYRPHGAVPADRYLGLVLPQRDLRWSHRYNYHRTLGGNHRAYFHGPDLALHAPDRQLLVRGRAWPALHLHSVAGGGSILPSRPEPRQLPDGDLHATGWQHLVCRLRHRRIRSATAVYRARRANVLYRA